MLRAIDLFAGCGGFTEAAKLAGVNVLWAANHWPMAVQYHAKNNPEVEHACQDLHQANWSKVPACDLVLASPCCQGHAHARGKDRPHHDASRSTAWAVVSCCEYHRPAAFIVENVPEFLRWNLYDAWKLAMQSLGYHISFKVIDAADCGIAQHRQRLFVVGALANPVELRKPQSHSRATAASIINLNAGRWSPINKPGRAAATLRRACNGRREFGEQFVMPYYGSGSGLTGRSLDRPLGTVTTKDRWAIVDGDRMRMLTVDEYRKAMSFKADMILPAAKHEAVHMLGNAVPPKQAAVVIEQVKAALIA